LPDYVRHLSEGMASFPCLADVLGKIDERLAAVIGGSVPIMPRPGPAKVKPAAYLLVVTGILHLAIALEDVSEAGPLPPITSLPNLPPWIQGIVNLRGEIISIIDLPGFLTLTGRGNCAGQRLVVLSDHTHKIGISLDRIVGRDSGARPVAQPVQVVARNPLLIPWFTSGLAVGDQVYSLLNVRKLLMAPRLIDYNRADWPEER